MKWSGLKARIEATFAPSVRGRIEVFVTRYRHAHDGAGEAWITLDGQRIACMGHYIYWPYRYALENVVANDAIADGHPFEVYGHEFHEAVAKRAHHEGVFSDEDFQNALVDYLNISIEDILTSKNTIIRAFGMLDARFGKRRLKAFIPDHEAELVRRLYAIRCDAEGIEPARGPE